MKKVVIIILSCILVLVLSFGIYVSDYYHMSKDAKQYLENSETVNVIKKDDYIVFEPTKEYKNGVIFYPGAKVEMESYSPLMHELAKKGVFSILLKMPFNLAIFGINSASGLTKKYDKIEKWYLGGHSLGGSMGFSYLHEHQKEFTGGFLLGSYTTSSFKNSNLKLISIYGENDLVLNKEKYNQYKSNLGNNYSEYVIEGGNHAYFGMYGKQSGDGKAEITNLEQIILTVNHLIDKF